MESIEREKGGDAVIKIGPSSIGRGPHGAFDALAMREE